MKILKLLLIFSLVSITSFAQQSCCDATVAFNDLSKDDEFKGKHTLKTYVGPELKGKSIKIEVEGDKPATVYARITKKKSNKYLFLIHEWWGLNDHIKGEADSYFETLEDVNVIALDLYDGKIATNREEAGAYMQSADKDRIFRIINAVNNWTGEQAKVCTVGWCFGGGWSMQSAIELEEKAAGCVVYYGMPESDPERLSDLNCDVVGIFASKDKWINEEVVSTYESAMEQVDKPFKTYWYNAVHAFANPSNEKYNEEYAAEANTIVIEYLEKAFNQ